MSNNPDPDDLFCPNCGANIEYSIEYEVEFINDAPLITHQNITIYRMLCCGAYVQDGEFLNRPEARERFG